MFLFLWMLGIAFTFSCQQGDSHGLLKPSEFENKLVSEPGVVLDVRSPEEFEKGHIIRALNLNMSDGTLAAKIDSLDKVATYYVYCQRNGRSHDAVELLTAKGFKNVYELDGGFENWSLHNKLVVMGNYSPSPEMTVEEYQKYVSSDTLTLIDFSAKWCGPCKKMTPMIEKIAHARSHQLKVLTIDVDANQLVAKKNEIEYLPTLVWYKKGIVAERIVGYHDEKEINKIIDTLLK